MIGSKVAKRSDLNCLYRDRDTILKSLYKNATTFKNGLVTVDCFSDVNFVLERALPLAFFSYTRTKTCSVCAETSISNRVFIDVNLNLLSERSIQNLQGCIQTELNEEARLTKKVSKCGKCGESMEITSKNYQNTILIDTKTSLQLSTGQSIRIPPCKLNDIPEILCIQDQSFTFVACVELRHGHYLCHIRRSNNVFYTYNDLNEKATKTTSSQKLHISTLFYIKNA